MRLSAVGRVGITIIFCEIILCAAIKNWIDDGPGLVYPLLMWMAVVVTAAALHFFARRILIASSNRAAEEKAFATPPNGSYQSSVIRRRLSSNRRIGTLPHFGLFAALALFAALLPAWIPSRWRLPYKGIWVSITSTSPPVRAYPSPPKIVLRVKSVRRLPEYSVNDRVVPLAGLHGSLKQKLKLQSNWVVYVDGDPYCMNSDVVDAIDAIQGVNAKVIVVTPATRHLLNDVASNAASRK